MKIWEILKEESTYNEEMSNVLVDYITSFFATGAENPIPVSKIVKFMRKQGFDVLPAQISDMLANTPFDVEGNTVVKRSKEGVNKGEIDAQKKKIKVKSLADRELNNSIKKRDL